MKNCRILTQSEKTIAVIEEFIAFAKRMEQKYTARIYYNVDNVKDAEEA
jgi:hypothetical protein